MRGIGKYVVLAVAGGLLIASASWGQAAKAKKAAAGPKIETEIEEITVTAQKREENIQEIPISVTAFSGAVLEQKGISDVVSLGEAVPNLTLHAGTGTTSSITVSMRGMGVGDPNPALSSTVGLYIDGVYIAKLYGSNFDLEDLDRVEVLRGPQGTLYGRNTIGGAVNFITKKPTEDRSITLKTEVGNYDTFAARVTANVPLIGKNGFYQSDAIGTLSLRETAGYKAHDGYTKNSGTGSSAFDNLSRVYTTTALRWQPNKDITVDFSYEYHRWQSVGKAVQLTYLYPGSPAEQMGAASYIHKNRVDSVALNSLYMNDAPNSLHDILDDGNHHMEVLTGAWDIGEVGPLGDVTLKSISAYRSFTSNMGEDLDGTPMHIADIGNRFDIQTWSQELQWVGSAPRIHYVLGGYYYGEYNSYSGFTVLFDASTNLPDKNFIKVKSYAPFGQATYTPPILNDKLSITGGIRYTQDQYHIDRHHTCAAIYDPRAPGINLCNLGIPGLGIPYSFDSSRGKAFGGTDAISPMGDVSYQVTDEAMVYFRVSRGFKGGGFNGYANTPETFKEPFTPEKLLMYEAGFKTQWWDNRLRLNADGFYGEWDDQQISVFRASPTGGVLTLEENAASSELWGMEFEGAVLPLPGLEITATYAFIAPKFKEWLDQEFDLANNPVYEDPCGTVPPPCNTKPKLVNVGDQRDFGITPKNQFSAGVSYTAPPTESGVFSAHVDVYWQDWEVFAPTQSTGQRAVGQPAYALVNGRLIFAGIPLQKGSLDLSVFGRNLFDRKYRSFGIDFGSGVGVGINTYGEPRTFGLGLTYNFTAEEAAPPPPAPVAQAAPPPPPPAKKKIVLRSVHFDFDKATLKADAKPILDEAIQVLKQEGSVDIVVEGHTDSVGTDQYNLALSRRRAETVRSYLVDHGIARSRITADGMGESKPVASNDTADGRAQNRRVELHVK